jgi:nucleotide-binding universal stress UspA family protein
MKRILLGLDGSTNSFKALEEAIALAKLYGAELHTISVEEVPDFSETIDEFEGEKEAEDSRYDEFVQKAKAVASSMHYPITTHVIVGHEVKTICEYAKKHKVDLLVIGFIGHSAIYKRIMGGTSLGLVRVAPCSVLVVK